MSRMARAGKLLFTVAIAGIAGAAPAFSAETTLAAGAGFRRPLAEIASAYEKQSGHRVLQVYGHIGQVIAQAKESGQVSLICGDRAVLNMAKGLAFSRFEPLGLGKLVVAFRKGLTLQKPEELGRADIKRIGIPDQKSAIYGKAGRQFIERSNLSAQLDAKLLPVATVPQVTSYITGGEVDAGFINATDAIGAGKNIGGFIVVDQALYEPVEVACGMVKMSEPSPVADGLAKFIASGEARAILSRYGL